MRNKLLDQSRPREELRLQVVALPLHLVVLDIDSLAARLKEGQPRVVDVCVDQHGDHIVDQFERDLQLVRKMNDTYLFVSRLGEELRVTLSEDAVDHDAHREDYHRHDKHEDRLPLVARLHA